MQTIATGKTAAKSSTRKTRAAEKQTLHLKSKHLVVTPTASEIADMIATAAYFRAEQRGFEPGHALEDWLEAEQQVRMVFDS
jgi:Protein of unknown function (DUF2934)